MRTSLVTGIAVVVACLVGVAQSLAHPDHIPSRARGGFVYREAVHALATSRPETDTWTRNTTVNWLPQLVSHSDPSLGTFQQRWWVDYSAWQEGDLAMLYINGEAAAHGSPDGYMSIYGRNVSAVMFGLEHRFYGESMPAPLTNRSMLSHLTVENALADLEYFRLWLEANVLHRQMRWFIVGGSYSGALSAWMKEVYPTSYEAAWSSSGVVNARFDYFAFDGHLKSVLPVACEKAIRTVFDAFSAAYDDAALRGPMMAAFGTPAYFTKADMAWMLADGSAMAVQYGYKNQLCNTIQPLNQSTPTSIFEQYATIIEDLWGANFGSSCYYSTECLSNPQYSDQWAAAGYSWVFQCCSQLAYWQTSYPKSLRLSAITTDYYIAQCRAAFGESTFPDTYAFNAKYGGATPNATKVIALQGSDDPWQTAGVQQSLGPEYPEVLAQCNQCGHCGDLMNPTPLDPPSLTAQRQAIHDTMNRWLGL